LTNVITFSGVLKKVPQRAETEIIVSRVVVATIIIIAIVIIMCVIYRRQTAALVKLMNFSDNKITNDIYLYQWIFPYVKMILEDILVMKILI